MEKELATVLEIFDHVQESATAYYNRDLVQTLVRLAEL